MSSTAPTNNGTHENAGDTFEFPGGSPGVLLVHCLSADAGSVRAIAEALNKLGLYCYAPLLPGHGTLPDKLHGITDEQWIDSARAGLARVREQHDQVIVVAFSMGGALTAIMLSEGHENVAAYIAIAPMITTRIPLLPIIPLLRRFFPSFYPLNLMSIAPPS